MKYITSILISTVIFFATVYAQDNSRWYAGAHLLFGIPSSQFGESTEMGEGIGAKILYQITKKPNISGRFDLSYYSYGEQIYDYYSNERDEAFYFTLGPQFQVNYKALNVYFAPMGGFFNRRRIYTDQYWGISIPTTSATKLGYNICSGVALDFDIGVIFDLGFKYQNAAVKRQIFDQSGNLTGEKIIKGDEYVIALGVLFHIKN
jgi:hypothetical protein